MRVEGEVFGEKGVATKKVRRLKPGVPIDWKFSFKSDFIGEDLLNIGLEYSAGGKRHALSLRGDTVSVFVLEYGRSFGDQKPVSIVVKETYGSDVNIVTENRRRRKNLQETMRSNEPVWQIVELVPDTSGLFEIVPGLRHEKADRIKLVISSPGRTRKVFVFSGNILRFGRNERDSSGARQDIILRRLPCRKEFYKTDDKEAYKANMSISRGQGLFLFNETGKKTGFFVRNVGNETSILVDGEKVPCNGEQRVKDRSIISLAGGALDLEAVFFCSVSRGGSWKIRQGQGAVELTGTLAGERECIDAVLLKRTQPDYFEGIKHVHEYLVLNKEAVAGTSQECALQIEERGIAAYHADLFTSEGEFFIKLNETGSARDISVDGFSFGTHNVAPLAPGSLIRIGEAEIRVGEVEFGDFKELDY